MATKEKRGGAGRKGYLDAYPDETLIKHLAACLTSRDGKPWVELDEFAVLAVTVLSDADASFNNTKTGLTKTGNYLVTRCRRLQKKGVNIPMPKRTRQAVVDWKEKAANLNEAFQGLLSAEQASLFDE
tara:strand:- start:607 stop:990 length:384 start_codon:yes stop_codon:yes gene_type:complete